VLKMYLSIVALIATLSCSLAAGGVQSRSWQDMLTLADSLSNAANYDSALAVSGLALDQARQELGQEDTVVAAIHYRVGMCLFEMLDYANAEQSLQQSLAIRNRLIDGDHCDLAANLYYLGAIRLRQARYDEAEPFFEQALAMRERLFGPRHPKVAKSLFGLTSLRLRQDRLADAEALGRRALDIVTESSGPDSPDIVTPSVILADVLIRFGRYREAAAYYKRSLEVGEKSLNVDHPRVARSMSGLAGVYYILGDYPEAESMYLRAAEIHEDIFGEDSYLVGIDLMNLGLLYMAEGRLDAAEDHYRRAVHIFETSLGPDHIFVGSSAHFLAQVSMLQRKYAEAESSLARALQITTKRFGPQHSETAIIMNSLADVHLARGEYGQADSVFRGALRILADVLGEEHPEVGGSLSGIATCHLMRGQYEQALEFYLRTRRISEQAYGVEHPQYAGSCESLSKCCRLAGDHKGSLEFAAQAVAVRSRNLQLGAMVMSEQDALTYARQMRHSVNGYLTAFLEAAVGDSVGFAMAADIVLSAKGSVSDEIFSRRKSVITETDTVTVALAENYRFAKFRLSQLFNEGPGEKTPEHFRRELDSLRGRINDLESELARRSRSFRTRQDRRDIRGERIAGLLPDNSVLVEYVSYDRHIGPGDSTRSRYLVVVVDNYGARDMVDIGPAEDIDALVDRYRHHLLDVSTRARGPSVIDQAQYETISRELYRAVLKPVEKRLDDRDLVFVSPDGGLTLVSFAGLQDEEGKYLIEKYPVHYLTSGRDLLRFMDVPPASTGLLAMGDPDYDATAEARLSSLRETQDAPTLPQNTPQPDSPQSDLRSGCGRLDEITVKPLPATRYEIEKVAESWRASSPEPAVVCLGSRAGEEALKLKAPGSRVIHLATHGYFLQGDCGTLFPQSGHTLDYGFVGENPLLLSGLFLAGANLHGRGADSIGADDGILSAEEVTALDLDGTELVVLSACETGLGRVTAGEGVYGLRRAFQLAGARTVVSALWPVSDEATADLMSGLYGRGSESLPQTMRAMQQQVIRELRSAGERDHPFSWGAFVAIGDWR